MFMAGQDGPLHFIIFATADRRLSCLVPGITVMWRHRSMCDANRIIDIYLMAIRTVIVPSETLQLFALLSS